MELKIDLDSVDGVAVGIVSGPVDLRGLQTAVVKLWQSVDGPELRILWDFRAARFEGESEDIRAFAEFVKRTAPKARLTTALVASTDLEFGLIRMFEVYREKENSTTAAFRDTQLALEWLRRTDGK